MPTKPCLTCGQLFQSNRGRPRCAECARQYQRQRDARRGTAAQRGYDNEWRKVRLAVLERDQWTCRYCGRPAITVDHVVPLAEGGARLDPQNLAASCRKCNSERGGATRKGRG